MLDQFTTRELERFWSRVRKTDTCWLWIPSDRHGRHGQFYVDGRLIGAHRFSWLIAYGSIPNGLDVLHRCDNKPCVRPEHLELGDQTKNTRDAVQRGLIRVGAQSPIARLTADDVRVIRSERQRGGTSCYHLALRYNVSPTTIANAVRGKTYR